MNKTFLLVTNENNIVKSAILARDESHLQALFTEECAEYGIDASDVNFEDGYIMLESGVSICMTYATEALPLLSE